MFLKACSDVLCFACDAACGATKVMPTNDTAADTARTNISLKRRLICLRVVRFVPKERVIDYSTPARPGQDEFDTDQLTSPGFWRATSSASRRRRTEYSQKISSPLPKRTQRLVGVPRRDRQACHASKLGSESSRTGVVCSAFIAVQNPCRGRQQRSTFNSLLCGRPVQHSNLLYRKGFHFNTGSGHLRRRQGAISRRVSRERTRLRRHQSYNGDAIWPTHGKTPILRIEGYGWWRRIAQFDGSNLLS
jgi:hypothetical protein